MGREEEDRNYIWIDRYVHRGFFEGKLAGVGDGEKGESECVWLLRRRMCAVKGMMMILSGEEG